MGRRIKHTAFVVYQDSRGGQKIEGAVNAERALTTVAQNKRVLAQWPKCGANRAIGIWRVKKRAA